MNGFRSDVRIMTIIYALAVVLTVAIGVLIGLSFDQLDLMWISLIALLIAETAVYELSVRIARSRSEGLMSGYMSYVAVAGVYLAAVVAAIVVSFIWSLAFWTYGLIHLVMLAAALIGAGFIALFAGYAIEQEQETSEQLKWIKQMGVHLTRIEHDLKMWEHPAKGPLHQELEALQEKVRYSDPVSRPELVGTEFAMLEQLQILAGDVRSLVQMTGDETAANHIGVQIRKLANSVELRNQQLLQLKS